MNFTSVKLLVMTAVLLLPFSIFPAEKLFEFNSEKNIIGFINYLYEDGEYQRAIFELDRYDFFYSDYSVNSEITRMLCMNKLGTSLVNTLYLKNENLVHEILYLDSINAEKSVYGKSFNLEAKEKKDEQIYYKRIFLNRLLVNDFTSAEEMLIKNNLNYVDFKEIDKNYNKFKSPYAGMIFGIFPGGGYIYAGNARTGFTALSVIGICFAASYFAAEYDSPAVAIASGTVGSLFYGGSILGGYLESKRYNKELQNEILKFVENKYEFESDRNYIFKNYGTGSINFKF